MAVVNYDEKILYKYLRNVAAYIYMQTLVPSVHFASIYIHVNLKIIAGLHGGVHGIFALIIVSQSTYVCTLDLLFTKIFFTKLTLKFVENIKIRKL